MPGDPNELVAQIHNRMPVILDYAVCDTWLESVDRALLERLLSPIPANLLAAYPVGIAVNKPNQGGPGLIEPLRDRGHSLSVRPSVGHVVSGM